MPISHQYINQQSIDHTEPQSTLKNHKSYLDETNLVLVPLFSTTNQLSSFKYFGTPHAHYLPLNISDSLMHINYLPLTILDSLMHIYYLPWNISDSLMHINYLPWNILDQDYPPSCTFSGPILQLCKVAAILVYLLSKSCAYKTYGQTDWGTWWFLRIPQKQRVSKVGYTFTATESSNMPKPRYKVQRFTKEATGHFYFKGSRSFVWFENKVVMGWTDWYQCNSDDRYLCTFMTILLFL